MAVIVRRTADTPGVMGIDPSSKTGVVVLRGSKVHSHIVTFPKEDGIQRLHMIAWGVLGLVSRYNPDHIFIEGLAYGNRFSLVFMAQVNVLIRHALYMTQRPWWEVPPTTLKKWVTGSGTADKKQMAKAVASRWGYSHKSDDVTDAYALAQLGRHVLSGNQLKGVQHYGYQGLPA